MHRNDYVLIGIAVVASLLILIPLGVGLAEAQVIQNATIPITYNNGTTIEQPAFTNSTGTFLISEWVAPAPVPEPVVMIQTTFEPLPFTPTVLEALPFTPITTVYQAHTVTQIGQLEFINESHYTYLEDYDGQYIPYRVIDDTDFVQVEVSGGKIVFDKINGATTIFKDDVSVINSDSYQVRMADVDSDVWSFLAVNESALTTTVLPDEDKVTITFTRENEEGKYDIEYEVRGNLKATAKFTNYIYEDTKFAFTQTLNLDDNLIELNDQTIDLNDYVGQTFPREILEQNQDLIIETGNLYYNSGLGFENLWSVGIFEDNKIALDYANVEQTVTAIGETVELDPSVTLSNDFANSGVIKSWLGYNAGTSTSAHCTASNKVNQIGGASDFVGIGYAYCNRSVIDFDITSIPDTATITDVDLESTKFYKYYHGSIGCEFRSMATNGISSSTSATTLWNDISSGTIYAQDTTTPCNVELGASYGNRWVYNVMWDLGTNADSDLQAELAVDNNWNIGLKGYLNGDGSGSVSYPSVVHGVGFYTTGYPMKLYVTYSMPPDPPTGFTGTSSGTDAILSWTAPTTYTPDGYRIQSSDDSVTWTDVSPTVTGLTATISMSYDETKHYRVQAFVGATNSSWSSNTIQIDIHNVPQPPTGLSTVTGIPLGTSWVSPEQSVTTDYKVHSFTTTGASTFQVTAGSGDVEYLVVGGGGGGGVTVGGGGGGGGAGGFLTATGYGVTAQSYSVTVGAGGAGAGGAGVAGSSGSNSIFDTITSTGGGGGGAWVANPNGLSGGSGGGGSYSGSVGSGTTGQGYDGGLGDTTGTTGEGAGGGGGSGSVGGNASPSNASGGNGGAGTSSIITGTAVTYAGGGGGGGGQTTGAGGTATGGGGAGGGTGGAGVSATPNTGGGGGGESNGSSSVAGSGGSGIVIIRYVDDGSITATGGTVTTVTTSQSNGGNGGSPITGYKVYRSDSAFPLTPLNNYNATQETDGITTSTGFEGLFHLDTLVEVGGADFSDSDFSSGWVQTGTEIVATGGEIVYTDVKANAVHRVVKPLGFTASDSLWTMTFKADISAMTHQSGRVNLGLTSDDLAMEASGTDGIYFQFTDWAGGADLRARINAWDGTSVTSCANVNITSNANGADYWIKMIRTTPTNVDTFIYSDEALTTLAFTVPSCTIPATITGLDYVTVTSHNAGITPSGMTGVTDDYRVWNGVSAIPTVSNLIYDYSGDDNHGIITSGMVSTAGLTQVDSGGTAVMGYASTTMCYKQTGLTTDRYVDTVTFTIAYDGSENNEMGLYDSAGNFLSSTNTVASPASGDTTGTLDTPVAVPSDGILFVCIMYFAGGNETMNGVGSSNTAYFNTSYDGTWTATMDTSADGANTFRHKISGVSGTIPISTNGNTAINPSDIDTGYSNEIQFTNSGLTITSASYPSGTNAWTINNIVTPEQTTSWTMLSAGSTAGDILFNVDDSFVGMSINGVDIFNKVLSTPMNVDSATAISITRTASGVYDLFINGTSQALGVTDTTSLGTITNDKWYMGMKPDLTNSGTWRSDEFSVESQVRANANEFGSRLTTELATTNSATTTYDDNSVVGGNEYYYSIKAENALGLSDYLTPFVSGLAGSPPDPPTITGTSIDNPNVTPLDITINWSSPLYTGTAGITNYEVYRDAILIDTVGNVNTYTDTVPSGGGTFVYSLKAVSSHGTSILSGTASQTTATPPPAPVSAPTLDIANPNPSPLDVTVSFAMPSSGGSAITSFEIFRSTDDITFSSVGTTTTLIFSDTVPNAGTFYYKFAGTNLIGIGSQSPSSSITTPTVPDAPTVTLAINDPDNLPFDITTVFVAGATGGSSIIDYTLEHSADGITYTPIATGITGTHTHTVSLAGTHYFQATARNSVGNSLMGVASNIDTPTIPTAPQTLTATTIDTSSIELNWILPTSDGGSIIQSFSVQNDATGSFVQVATVVGTATTYTHPNLDDATNYNYQVIAINNVGSSNPSNQDDAWTIPDAPVGLVANTISSNNSLELTWTQPTGTVTDYRVERALTSDGIFTTSQSPTYATSCSGVTCVITDTGLTSGSQYMFQIYASNLGGESTVSTNSTNWTVNDAPTQLAVTLDSNNSSESYLSWTSPSGTYTGFQIERETPVGGGWVTIESDTGLVNILTDTGLTLTTDYNYRISSINLGGISVASAPVSITTLSPPDPPTDITFDLQEISSSLRVQLNWVEPTNLYTGTLSGYMVERNDGTGWAFLTNIGTSPAMIDTDIQRGVNYEYRVSGITQIATGSPSVSNSFEFVDGTFDLPLTAVQGNTLESQSSFTKTFGDPVSYATNILIVKHSADNAVITTVASDNNLILSNSTTVINGNKVGIELTSGVTQLDTQFVYETSEYTYTGYLTTIQDGVTHVFSSTNSTVAPLNPFGGSTFANEFRDELTYQTSTVELYAEPAGYDAVLRYQHQDPTIEPFFYGFENVQANNTSISPVLDDKDFYVSVYINPEKFDFVIDDPQTGLAHIECNKNSPLNCPAWDAVYTPSGEVTHSLNPSYGALTDIPDGIQSDFVTKSFKSPDSPQSFGLEPLGDLFGMPMVFIFVIGLGAVFTGRSAQMGVIFIAVTIGIMLYMGYISFDFGTSGLSTAVTWGIIIVAMIGGILVGKRWS